MSHPSHCLSDLVLSFEGTINTSRNELADAVDRVKSVVRTLPCAKGNLHNLQGALLEALTNAVIHGNRENPAKRVTISAGCDALARLVIAVTDQGEGFDPSTLPDPTAGENLCASHGRGVFLMRRLVDEVEFN